MQQRLHDRNVCVGTLPARAPQSQPRTLLRQDAQELQAVQLELEGLVRLPRSREVDPLVLHPLQRWLQVAVLDLSSTWTVTVTDQAKPAHT